MHDRHSGLVLGFGTILLVGIFALVMLPGSIDFLSKGKASQEESPNALEKPPQEDSMPPAPLPPEQEEEAEDPTERLRMGLSYSTVERIMGAPGTKSAEAQIRDKTWTTYQWNLDDGPLTAEFENGVLQSWKRE